MFQPQLAKRVTTIMKAAKLRGFIRTFVGALILSSFGMIVFLWGLEGWTSGEIMVHPKGRQAFLAAAGGPDPKTFLFTVWGYLLVGGVLSLTGPLMLLYLLLGPRARVQKGLVRAGLASPKAGSPTVPRWCVVLVLAGLLSFFGYILVRGS
jgi:hypothetical protein